jgi:hypothetical protein
MVKGILFQVVRAGAILLMLCHCHLTYAYNNMEPCAWADSKKEASAFSCNFYISLRAIASNLLLVKRLLRYRSQ